MKSCTRKNLDPVLLDTSRWPDPVCLPDDPMLLRTYREKKSLIEGYLHFDSVSAACKSVGYYKQQMLRDLTKCVSIHEDGRIYGWRALIEKFPRKAYTRTAIERLDSSTGKSGMLSAYFRIYPGIQESIDDYILRRKRSGKAVDGFVTPLSIHREFLRLAGTVDPHRESWPFTTKSMGRTAIGRYGSELLNENFELIVEAQYGSRALAKSKTNTGHRSMLSFSQPFDCVQLDEHTGDVVGILGWETPKGTVWLTCPRVQIIAVVDRWSLATIGYLVITTSVDANDILRSIHCAVTPMGRFDTIFERSPSSGFPSGAIDALARTGFVVLMFDNALSHLAEQVAERATLITGCMINYGATRRFERRAAVEAAFGKLETRGFRLLPSSTGTGPSDPRRKNFSANAHKHKVMIGDLIDMIGEVFAESNGDTSAGNFSLSPMEALRSCLDDVRCGFIPPSLPKDNNGAPLDELVLNVRVRGNRAKGDRPHINFKGARYSCPDFANDMSRIGCTVVAHVKTNDVSSLVVTDLPTRKVIGTLTALHQWYGFSHSLSEREQILDLIRTRQISLRANASVQSQYLTYLATQGRASAERSARHPTSKSAARLAANDLASKGEASRSNDAVSSAGTSVHQVMEWDPDELTLEEGEEPMFKAVQA